VLFQLQAVFLTEGLFGHNIIIKEGKYRYPVIGSAYCKSGRISQIYVGF
jgi:hypothetical protein